MGSENETPEIDGTPLDDVKADSPQREADCGNLSPVEVPPAQVPPPEVPPTEVPPTEVPPTEVPPTEVPPTEIPLAKVPPANSTPQAGTGDNVGALWEEIKNQETHNLYCQNCTHNITKNAQLFKKGEETFPYNKDKYLVGFFIAISFKEKYPFIEFRGSNATCSKATGSNAIFLYWLWFLLVVVVLLLFSIFLWLLFSPTPPLPTPSPSPSPYTNGNSTNTFTNAKKITEDIIATISHYFVAPVIFLLIVAIILALSFAAKLRHKIWGYIVVPFQRVSLKNLDILKSIVYGGLIESITSFGVVSSAAATRISAFNVLALGLANLFTGLFLIINNLYGLVTCRKPFDIGANSDNTAKEKNPKDPYEELLGDKKHLILHCVVVVVSFIFFGVIPLFFYGLSFKIAYNEHYEPVVVVAAASLVCVISLSFGKAHAFKMDKLKTVAVYTGIAIGASALSFFAGQHLRDLFEKYDFLNQKGLC